MCRLNGLGSNYSPKMAGETCKSSIYPHHNFVQHSQCSPIMSHRAQLYLSKHLHSAGVNAVFWGEEKQIKALFPCKYMKMRAEVERKAKKRKEKKTRGRDGGWKWSGASVLYECLCAALAKKNKA